LGADGQLRQAASFPPETGEREEALDATCEAALQAITERTTITIAEGRSSTVVGATEAGEAVYLPLLAPGGPIGVLALSARPTRKFRRGHVEFLEALCSEASTAVENVQLRAQLNRLASTDHLTGIYNRREVERRLSVEVDRAIRHGRPLTVLMIDIDNLKRVNDRYGHAAGDEVVCLLGRILSTNMRSSDVAGRVGGDEFLVVLPEVDANGGAALAQRLIHRFDAELPTLGDWEDAAARVGISVGIASSGEAALSADRLFSRADEALYEAKREGKGRFRVAREQRSAAVLADGTGGAC
jgi:two-component system cell cycle response regulator